MFKVAFLIYIAIILFFDWGRLFYALFGFIVLSYILFCDLKARRLKRAIIVENDRLATQIKIDCINELAGIYGLNLKGMISYLVNNEGIDPARRVMYEYGKLRYQHKYKDEDIIEMINVYGIDEALDILKKIDSGIPWIGATERMVQMTIGDPDVVRFSGNYTDWCYSPSASGKRFAKRVSFGKNGVVLKMRGFEVHYDE